MIAGLEAIVGELGMEDQEAPMLFEEENEGG
jgi:hypothetical protein